MPAWGPPSSLSPLAVTRSAPAASMVVISGSSGSVRCGPSSPEPMSTTSGTPQSARSAGATDEVNPRTTKLDGCTLSTNAVVSSIAEV